MVAAFAGAGGVGLVAELAGDPDLAAFGEAVGDSGELAPGFDVDPQAVASVVDGEAEGGDDSACGVAAGRVVLEVADEGDGVHGVLRGLGCAGQAT